jgi:hypothetical protein
MAHSPGRQHNRRMVSCHVFGLLLTSGIVLGLPGGDRGPDPKPGFALIREDDLLADMTVLASAEMEGRDSPSVGLSLAGDYIISRLEAAGYSSPAAITGFRQAFERQLPAPVKLGCSLSVSDEDGSRVSFTYGEDFVPVWKTSGDATGEAVVLAFGIDSDADRYDDITGKLAGKIAVVLSGEPRHRRKFDGPEVTFAADLYQKLESLQAAGLAGVLVVRRPDPTTPRDPNATPEDPPRPMGFRHTWAIWNGEQHRRPKGVPMPVLEITPEVAAQLTGVDLLDRARGVDKSARPPKPIQTGRTVTIRAAWEERGVSIDNIVGELRGSDPELADEYVVLGAHYDHVGVDARGRIGFGADDNASGVAAMLEIAEALASNPPRRSVLVCAFAAEEDGLVGSKALCDAPPVPAESMVAMLNMDMIGRGETKQVVVLGVTKNPGFEKLLERARKALPTKIKDIVTGQGLELFQRSDHYSFHQIGVPVLFFFEGLPIGKNEDYHTWRDTVDRVDVKKVANTSRLVFSTAWLLANQDERPPPPKKSGKGR